MTYDEAVDNIVAAALSAVRARRFASEYPITLPDALDVLEAALAAFYGGSLANAPPCPEGMR